METPTTLPAPEVQLGITGAPTGTTLHCKSWVTEAAYRMLLNNLDPAVAENPRELVVYGGTGKAARNPESFAKILETLKTLNDDETLLVQSGKPVGVLKSHPDAPRVLISNSMLVPAWADWTHFREYERQGLIMYGQMTAGSWIYIGSQGNFTGNLPDVCRGSETAFQRRFNREVCPFRRPRRNGRRTALGRQAEQRGFPGRGNRSHPD